MRATSSGSPAAPPPCLPPQAREPAQGDGHGQGHTPWPMGDPGSEVLPGVAVSWHCLYRHNHLLGLGTKRAGVRIAPLALVHRVTEGQNPCEPLSSTV